METEVRVPAISVIAVSFNHEKWIIETLESIRRQTFQDFEVIYCDDASSDRSAELARDWFCDQDLSHQVIVHDVNVGICKTLNEALQKCRGKYVQLISCDDMLLPDKFCKQMEVLEAAGGEVAGAYSSANLIDASGKPRYPYTFEKYQRREFPAAEGLYETLLVANRIAAMSVLVRRSVLVELGGFDESLPIEDWDMWLRILERYRFVGDPNPTALYRVHGSNLHLKPKDWRQYGFPVLSKHRSHPLARRGIEAGISRLLFEGEQLNSAETEFIVEVSRDQSLAQESIVELMKLNAEEMRRVVGMKRTITFRVGEWLLWPIALIARLFPERFRRV